MGALRMGRACAVLNITRTHSAESNMTRSYRIEFYDADTDTMMRGKLRIAASMIQFKADDSPEWIKSALVPKLTLEQLQQLREWHLEEHIRITSDECREIQRSLNRLFKERGVPDRAIIDYDDSGYITKVELIKLKKDLC